MTEYLYFCNNKQIIEVSRNRHWGEKWRITHAISIDGASLEAQQWFPVSNNLLTKLYKNGWKEATKGECALYELSR